MDEVTNSATLASLLQRYLRGVPSRLLARAAVETIVVGEVFEAPTVSRPTVSLDTFHRDRAKTLFANDPHALSPAGPSRCDSSIHLLLSKTRLEAKLVGAISAVHQKIKPLFRSVGSFEMSEIQVNKVKITPRTITSHKIAWDFSRQAGACRML